MCVFEKFEVDVHDSQRFFHKRFPYKVVVQIPAYAIPRRYSDSIHYWKSAAYFNARDARNKFLLQVDRGRQRTDAKNSRNTITRTSAIYYFLEEKDAVAFVAHNEGHAKEVFRPVNQKAVDAMVSDSMTVIRNSLFYSKFTWAVRFKWLRQNQEDEVAERVAAYFAGVDHPDERFLFSHSSQPSLYVQEEGDVVLLKIALSDFISRIEKAVLRSEII